MTVPAVERRTPPTVWGGSRAQPLVIAHRGASRRAPENSLAAFRIAHQQGADGVELDVIRCGSGELIVFHDDDLLRLGKRPGITWNTGYATLREIDLGGGERIPLLDHVLEELPAAFLLNLELKSPPTWRTRLPDFGLAQAVADTIARHGHSERFLVSSFDPILLWRFRRAAPEVQTGLLFSHEQSWTLRRGWIADVVKPAALHPDAALVDAVELARWRARGYAIHVWTVDDPQVMLALRALGVDGIITNEPGVLRQLIATSRRPAPSC